MKPDIYTKTVLTLIALLLTVILLKPLISPDTAVRAQSSQKTTSSKMISWEYKEISDGVCRDTYVIEDEKQIPRSPVGPSASEWVFTRAEELGAQGWELTIASKEGALWLKRPKP
jgi:hypothetical protein